MTNLTRSHLDRLAISNQGKLGISCADHPKEGTDAIYQDGVLRLLCRGCGFEVVRVKVASTNEDAA